MGLLDQVFGSGAGKSGGPSPVTLRLLALLALPDLRRARPFS